jgi:hypothetical protein
MAKMAMHRIFQHNKKKWRIAIRYSKKVIYVEVWSDIYKEELHEIFAQMFKDCRFQILSQFIDSRIYDIGDRASFIKSIKSKYSVDAWLMSDYIEGWEPLIASRTFVVNVAGILDKNLLDETFNFGTRNLSNIFYGINDENENWKDELLNWNKSVLSWFNLEKNSEEAFGMLINKIGPIELTIDGRPFFCITEVTHLNKLLRIIKHLSKENGYTLEAKIMDISGKDT